MRHTHIRMQLLCALAVVSVVLMLITACSFETPDATFNIVETPQSSHVYDRNGTLITELRGEQGRTDITSLDLIPKTIQQAVIAIEDERFYSHDGVDYKAIVRAARSNVTSGGISQGGSTITQQYVGNVFLDRSDQTASRKVQEIFMSRRFEQSFTKDFILLKYLNWVYFGNGAYGIEAAAREYFGAPSCETCLKVSELGVDQAALLAGLIQRPSALNPYRNPDGALRRRNLVLERMLANEFITIETYEVALARPLVLVEDVAILEREYPAAHFVEDVKQWFLNNPAFGDTREQRTQLLFEGGLKIHTTIDLELQAEAEAAVEKILPDNGQNPDAASVTLGVNEDEAGHVLAMVGGRNFFGEDSDAKFNLASGKGRQAGSAMKPVALAVALASGLTAEYVYDAPSVITIDEPDLCGTTWNVHGGRGSTKDNPVSVDLQVATSKSINVVYAQLMVDIEPVNFVSMAEALGARKDSISPVCAAVLGTEDVNMLELASIYSTFGRSGEWIKPAMVTEILRHDGTSIYQNEQESALVLQSKVAHQITSILETVITEGTGKKAAINRPAAGKTGTAQNYADATFAGYTTDRATAVWVGYPDAQRPMVPPATPIRVSGGSYPAMIWKEIMLAAHKNTEVTQFPSHTERNADAQGTSDSAHIEVPDITGRNWNDESLIPELEPLPFKWIPVEISTSEFEPGVIFAQTPAAGSMHPADTTIILEVALEPFIPVTVTMPDVTNLSEAQARQVLASDGLTLKVIEKSSLINGEILLDEQTQVPPDVVWRQEPSPGDIVATGHTVTIWVQP